LKGKNFGKPTATIAPTNVVTIPVVSWKTAAAAPVDVLDAFAVVPVAPPLVVVARTVDPVG
jgi:hypothetical protein